MSNQLHCITVNVRGVREKTKRLALFRWLKQQKCDIALFQETHFTSELEDCINNEWDGKAFHSFGSAHSKGVSIFTKQSSCLNIIDVNEYVEGRGILLNITVDDTALSIFNIYAPNDMKSRNIFFKEAKTWCSKKQIGALIVGGDFNEVINQKNDRISRQIQHGPLNKTTQLKHFISHLDLTDVWREINPDTCQYTWRTKDNRSRSRLDMWLVENSQMTNITSCDIRPSVLTDHQSVSVKINIQSQAKGPGYWKLNSNHLQDEACLSRVRTTIKFTVDECKQAHLSSRLTWDLCKLKVKETFIRYSKDKARISRTRHNTDEARLNHLLKLVDQSDNVNSADNQQIVDEVNEIQLRLNEDALQQAKGAQIRSRAQWVEQGEKSSKFFLGLEKSRQTKKVITQLYNGDNTIVSNLDSLLECQVNFYKTLYSSKNIPPDSIDDYLHSADVDNALTEQESATCDGLLLMDECTAAVNNMKCNKAPGQDGLTCEFYKTFWLEIKDIVVASLNEGYDTGEMSVSQRRAILTLLFKKGDPKLLANWRPISLLNVDFKIAAHALASRLHKVLPKIISSDQSGYIRGRYIGTNIRLIQDIIDNTETNKLSGAILFLDFKKAFDMVEWPFMFKTLRHFGFGPSFIRWVETMYTNIQSSINHNGWISEPFSLHRGVRQGCPLSALLFIIVAEILAIKIRNDDQIKGIKLPDGQEAKISQLADDTCIFVREKTSVSLVLDRVDQFSSVAGPELNKMKTEGLWLGNFKGQDNNYAGISWPDTPIKSLGIYYGHNKAIVSNLNWQDKLDKLKKLLNQWRTRHLTLYGKVTIIKTLALSQFTYAASVMSVPKDVVKELKREIYCFLWNSKNDKVKRTVIINSEHQGGLNMIDIDCMFDKLKANWIVRLNTMPDGLWKVIPQTIILYSGINLAKCNLDIKWFKFRLGTFTKMPEFYKNVLISWINAGGGSTTEPVTFAQIRQQVIWGNKFVTVKGKPLFLKKWISSKIVFVNDLLDCNNVLNSNSICHKLTSTKNWMVEFALILKALPKIWLNKIRSSASLKTKVKTYDCINFGFETKHIVTEETQSRLLYRVMVEHKATQPYTFKKWESTYKRIIIWDAVWNFLHIFVKENVLKQFKFRLIHYIQPCGALAYQWKQTVSPLCETCKIIDDYQHMFIDCKSIKPLWHVVTKVLDKMMFTSLVPSLYVIVFGYKIWDSSYYALNYLLVIIGFTIVKFNTLKNTPKAFRDPVTLLKCEINKRIATLKILQTSVDHTVIKFCQILNSL